MSECPFQVVLPRQQLTDDSGVSYFLLTYVGKFDMYVEDDYWGPSCAIVSRIRWMRKSSGCASNPRWDRLKASRDSGAVFVSARRGGKKLVGFMLYASGICASMRLASPVLAVRHAESEQIAAEDRRQGLAVRQMKLGERDHQHIES